MEGEEGDTQLIPRTKFRQQQRAVCRKKHVLSKQAEEIFLKRSFEGREGEVRRPFWSLPLSTCLPSTDASGLGRPLPRREAGAAPQT